MKPRRHGWARLSVFRQRRVGQQRSKRSLARLVHRHVEVAQQQRDDPLEVLVAIHLRLVTLIAPDERQPFTRIDVVRAAGESVRACTTAA